ncbi:MAG: GNAT family N-acetyltransferase [Acholeplasmatales bacterium]|nr:GNAT family N-acetyltransferase [Acholeplasmatales bacterium]
MEIRILKNEEFDELKNGIQYSFQNGFERYFGKTDEIIIPDKDIIESYKNDKAITFVALIDGNIVGGAIVNVDGTFAHLDILYVKVGYEGKGIGFKLWNYIERYFKDVKIWHTCTPYFDQRNIYFYLNKCHFKAVEFIREINEDGFIGDHGEGMFEFEKIIND